MVIDEISLVGARMINVINNKLKFIKHIKKQIFHGFDFMMTSDFYQAPHMKDNYIFQNVKDNVNALAPIFWQTYIECYELNKIM